MPRVIGTVVKPPNHAHALFIDLSGHSSLQDYQYGENSCVIGIEIDTEKSFEDGFEVVKVLIDLNGYKYIYFDESYLYDNPYASERLYSLDLEHGQDLYYMDTKYINTYNYTERGLTADELNLRMQIIDPIWWQDIID
jgi:hypothetical protein